ncbi:MAG: Response regulator PleD [Firmicutes bacterium ADurb.Bin146]|jgi:diguanylate cyclase (GGDEF)-like protein|nr:MAG: Response regulator PleD [Firmicutes bacterium ADurb.Bin146]
MVVLVKNNGILNKFLTNNNKYEKDDPDYGKVYLLNTFLITISAICAVFGILNIIKTNYPLFILFHILIMLLSILTIIYFHRTNNIRIASTLLVILATFLIAAFIYFVKNDHFGLFWFAAYPPFTYFMLGRKKGRIATMSLGILVFFYIILTYKEWKPATFDYISIINIFGASIILILLIVFYEKSKKQAEEALVIKNNQLHVMSITDRLTGLYNRYKLDETLYELHQKSKNCEKSFSIIIADIDHFKYVNDTYGHQVGDKVLISISNLISSSVKTIDIVGRWGGEEFLIICPDTDYSGIKSIAKTIETNISNYKFENYITISISLGVAVCDKESTIDSLLHMADKNMYEIKENRKKS